MNNNNLPEPVVLNIVDDDLNGRIDRELGVPMRGMSSGSSMDSQAGANLKKLREKVIVYEYMCYKTSSYFNFINRCFLIPSIILSSVTAFLNSSLGVSDGFTHDNLRLFNMVSNGVLTMLISIQNSFKFAEKADYFFTMKKKFTKLHNTLNNDIVQSFGRVRYDNELVLNHMREYDQLDENLQYEFPVRIIRMVRKRFKECALPTICNGIEIVENDVSIKGRGRRLAKKFVIPGVGGES